MSQRQQHNGHDPEAQMERQMEAETQQAMRQRATEMGAQSQSIQELIDNDDLLDRLLDPDITRDENDELEETLQTELSSVYQTANLSRREVEMMQTWSDQEAHLVTKEYPDRRSLATGTRGAIMYGPASPAEMSEMGGDVDEKFGMKPPLTDEMERRIWGAADMKKAMLTRSKDGWLVRRFTEFVAVGVNERRNADENSGGILSGIKNRLI